MNNTHRTKYKNLDAIIVQARIKLDTQNKSNLKKKGLPKQKGAALSSLIETNVCVVYMYVYRNESQLPEEANEAGLCLSLAFGSERRKREEGSRTCKPYIYNTSYISK